MNKEEIKEKLNTINQKMKDLNEKIKESADTVAVVGMETKDRIVDKVKDTKGDIEALKENYRLSADRAKSKFSSELLKAQMNIQVAKEMIQDKKEAYDKEKLEEYIDNEIEYAGDCIAMSLLIAEEAKLAFLEAIEAQKEYDEKYGEDK